MISIVIHDLERVTSLRVAPTVVVCHTRRINTIPSVELASRKLRPAVEPSYMLLLLDNKFYYCFTRYTLVYCALSLFYFNILDFYLRRLCYLNGNIIINCVIYSILLCLFFSFLHIFPPSFWIRRVFVVSRYRVIQNAN